LQVRFTLPNRRGRDFLCGLGLLHLLDDLEVLDFGDALTAHDAITETHEHVLQASRRAWRYSDRCFADQVADDADFLIHRRFACGCELDDHRTTATESATATEAAATAAESTATAPTNVTATTAAAASEPTTTFSARSGSFARTAPRASVIENARKSDSDDDRTDNNFSHDAEMSLVPPIN
jgi:hypothetical protein